MTHVVHTRTEERHEAWIEPVAFFAMLRAAGHLPADVRDDALVVTWDDESGLKIAWTERRESTEVRP